MENAARHAVPGTYLEPFALRTLGVARGDAGLLARAQQRFEEMGFDSHAAQTRSLGLDVVGWRLRGFTSQVARWREPRR